MAITPVAIPSSPAISITVSSALPLWSTDIAPLYVFTPVDTSGTFFPWLDGSRVGYHSFALAYDIGSLKHLEELGIDPVRL